MRHETLLNPTSTLLLVIDFQEKLLPAMNAAAATLANAQKLATAASYLNLPVIVTEQYPQGLGKTVAALNLPATTKFCEKITFSAAATDEFMHALKELLITQILIVGIEAHICVLQTALDLHLRGYQVQIAADAVTARAPQNTLNALTRLQNAGIIITNTESALFEMTGKAGTEAFKAIAKLVK